MSANPNWLTADGRTYRFIPKDKVVVCGNVELKECIGRGNFGDVYKGVSLGSHDIVAVKAIDLDKSEDDIPVLLQEIQLLRDLSSPYITKWYDTCVEDVTMFISMEYCGAGSCTDLLRWHKSLSEVAVAYITKSTLKGLAYLHQFGVIHRDVKSANILLTEDGEVKLADFGVSGKLDNGARRKTFVGTPYWLAPEIITKKSGYNEKVDIWSLGITVIELRTGRVPHSDEEPMKALYQLCKRPPPELTGYEYSQYIKDFTKVCLQKDPELRPSAENLLRYRFITRTRFRTNPLIQLIKEKQESTVFHPKKRQPKHPLERNVNHFAPAIKWNFQLTKRLSRRMSTKQLSPVLTASTKKQTSRPNADSTTEVDLAALPPSSVTHFENVSPTTLATPGLAHYKSANTNQARLVTNPLGAERTLARKERIQNVFELLLQLHRRGRGPVSYEGTETKFQTTLEEMKQLTLELDELHPEFMKTLCISYLSSEL